MVCTGSSLFTGLRRLFKSLFANISNGITMFSKQHSKSQTNYQFSIKLLAQVENKKSFQCNTVRVTSRIFLRLKLYLNN